MDGFLIIDKPAGMTSHDVVRRVRRALKIRRVGHTGTLDPLATGVLPVAVGVATRLVEFLSASDKTYRASLCLGTATTTQDAEGEVVTRLPYDGLTRDRFEAVASDFVGDVEQLPPMFSAVKVKGQPLYKLARKGLEVDRKKRWIKIHRLKILSFEPPLVDLEVVCSKGTYIRTLGADLAEALGTVGHLAALRRTQSGGFSLDDSMSLDRVEEIAMETPGIELVSMLKAMKDYPGFEITAESAKALMQGIPPGVQNLTRSPQCSPGSVVTLHRDVKLLAVARFAPERSREKRGDFELLKVFNHN